MGTLRFYGKLIIQTLGKLCRRRGSAAGLTLLCVLLPLCVAPAAARVVEQGVDFSGLTRAVTAPEGDNTPALLEKYMGQMSDISRYCTFVAMEEGEARRALETGEVTAILALPEDFVHGIMYGTNPDVTVIVPEGRPLESLLLLWVGQSAADILSAFQAGVYAVLDLQRELPEGGISYQEAMTGINMEYISWVLNRGDMYRVKSLSAAVDLPLGLHYGLSVLAYLALAMAPVFSDVYDRESLSARRRLRAVGRCRGFAADVTACTLVLFVPVAAALVGLMGLRPFVLLAAAWFALFCALFGAVCCLITPSRAGCGAVSFALSLFALGLGGGIVPPVLLPATLQRGMALSPVTWLREMAAAAGGEMGVQTASFAAPGVFCVVLALCAAALYRRRADGKEGAV